MNPEIFITWLPQDAFAGKPEVARSPKWPALAKAWLENNPECAACGTTENVVPHHLKPVHLFPELELDESNLETLCESPSHNCHLLFGHCLLWAAWNPACTSDATRMRKRVKERMEKR